MTGPENTDPEPLAQLTTAISDIRNDLTVLVDDATYVATDLVCRRDSLETVRTQLARIEEVETTRRALYNNAVVATTAVRAGLDDDRRNVAGMQAMLHTLTTHLDTVETALTAAGQHNEPADPNLTTARHELSALQHALHQATTAVTTCQTAIWRTQNSLRPLLGDLTRHALTAGDSTLAVGAGVDLSDAHSHLLTASLQTRAATTMAITAEHAVTDAAHARQVGPNPAR